MHQFSKGVFLFLLTCVFYTVSGRIVPDFSECKDFFYNGIPPQGIEGEYQPICQQYKNKYRFATLYSPSSHVPLYSAYKVSRSNVPRPRDDEEWMYEPQVRSKKTSNKQHLNKSTIWISASQLCKLSNHKI